MYGVRDQLLKNVNNNLRSMVALISVKMNQIQNNTHYVRNQILIFVRYSNYSQAVLTSAKLIRTTNIAKVHPLKNVMRIQ